MATIKIEKDIFVRDEYNVRRRVWRAGQEVESYVYHAVLRTNTPVNPEDLPIEPKNSTPSLNSKGMETKELPIEEVPVEKKKKKSK